MGTRFETAVAPRLSDLNLAGHVDNVEVVRVFAEARLLFLRFADLTAHGVSGGADDARGLLADHTVADLIVSQQIEYRAELGFDPEQPYRVQMWVSRIGSSSFTLDAELRMAADQPPSAVIRITQALREIATGAPLPIEGALRERLECFAGEPLTLR